MNFLIWRNKYTLKLSFFQFHKALEPSSSEKAGSSKNTVKFAFPLDKQAVFQFQTANSIYAQVYVISK